MRKRAPGPKPPPATLLVATGPPTYFAPNYAAPKGGRNTMPTTATEATAGNGTIEGAGITIQDPRTGEALWTVPEAGPEAVNNAVSVARSQAAGWAGTAP